MTLTLRVHGNISYAWIHLKNLVEYYKNETSDCNDYCFQLGLFKHRMEVCDAVIVAGTMCLVILFGAKDYQADGVGLLISLRLWRIHNICQGAYHSCPSRYKYDKPLPLYDYTFSTETCFLVTVIACT